MKQTGPLPLYGVQLLAAVGETRQLTGYECLLDGPLGDPRYVSQTWMVLPSPIEDLREAEARLSELNQELADVNHRLALANDR